MKDKAKGKKPIKHSLQAKAKLDDTSKSSSSSLSHNREKMYYTNLTLMVFDDGVSTTSREEEWSSSEGGDHPSNSNYMVSEVGNLLIQDLLDTIPILTSSLSKAKKKNIHLKKLVNILKDTSCENLKKKL